MKESSTILVPALLVAGAATMRLSRNKVVINWISTEKANWVLRCFSASNSGMIAIYVICPYRFQKAKLNRPMQFTGVYRRSDEEYKHWQMAFKGDGDNSCCRLAFAGLSFGRNVAFILVVTTVSYDIRKHGPVCCWNLVAIPTRVLRLTS